MALKFLPVTKQEIKELGWDYVDAVIVSGDAYVDHPSFCAAVIGRVLETEGYRVAILPQPEWQDCEAFRIFGKPRLFFGITAGNMDSMLNRYTHNRKPRSSDAFSEGGQVGTRPDRATIIYAQKCREAYKDVPVVIGGIEATMRRFAHYDYWSDKVRKPVLLDSKADLQVYGMGEKQITEIAGRLSSGEKISEIRDIRGTVYPLGAKETEEIDIPGSLTLPSAGEVAGNRVSFSKMTAQIYLNSNPYNAKALIQKSGGMAVVQNPPSLPLSEQEMDKIYDIPYAKLPHPFYKKPIAALETVKDSIIIHRGCYGGCAFCSLTLHQGHFIQCRSEKSILKEAEKLIDSPDNKGYISDLGAPSANMYGTGGKDREICQICRRNSCLFPSVCKNLNSDPGKVISLMRKVREIKGLKKVFIASGIRMDLSLCHEEYISEIAKYHTSGQLKVAPEHISESVLKIMHKPGADTLEKFTEKFKKYSRQAGKEQYLVHYFISAHPGSDLKAMAELALYLKERGIRPQQVNDFLPAPGEYATSIYFTGLDPMTLQPVYVPKKEAERHMQRALLQYYKPENRSLVVKALTLINRRDLINRILR